MRINGPTTQIIQPSDVDTTSKGQSPGAFDHWDFGLTKFPGPSELGLPTQAVLAAHPPVTDESNASLATALKQQYSV